MDFETGAEEPPGSYVTMDPEKRLKLVVERGFMEAYEMASRGPCCMEEGLAMLDRRLHDAKRLLKKMGQYGNGEYGDMVSQKYNSTLKNIGSLGSARESLPYQADPVQEIENAVEFGFDNSIRVASFSYERGMKMFGEYEKRAYNMIEKLCKDDRTAYEKILNEKFDQSFSALARLRPENYGEGEYLH